MRRHLARIGLVLLLTVSACAGEADSTSTTEPAATTIVVTSTLAPTTSTSTTSTTATPTLSTTTLSTTTTSTTAAPTTTSTTQATTTTQPVAACPAGPAVPAEAADLTGVDIDVDGDGLVDRLQTYAVPSEGRWHVRLEYGGGGAADEAIVDSDLVGAARPIGAVDLEGDGTPEAFLVVGSGAATLLVGLYDIDGCAITRVTVDGAPAVFPVGATVGNVSGLTCEGVGDLDRLFASRVGDDAFEGGFEPFTLAGSVLTAGFGDGAGFTDEEAAALATLECGGLTLP